MNTKISFFLLLVLLVILLLFYYIDLESNIIILLGVTIVVLMHNLISKKEHFNNNTQKAAELDAKIDVLLTIAKALANRTSDSSAGGGDTSIGVTFSHSCPFTPPDGSAGSPSGQAAVSSTVNESDLRRRGIDLGIGSSLDTISPNQLISSINTGS